MASSSFGSSSASFNSVRGASTSVMNAAKGASMGVLASSKAAVRTVAWGSYKLLAASKLAIPIAMMSKKALSLAGGPAALGSGGFSVAFTKSVASFGIDLNTLGAYSAAAAPFALASVAICSAIDSILNGTNDVEGAPPLSQKERQDLLRMENALTNATLNYTEAVNVNSKGSTKGDQRAKQLINVFNHVADTLTSQGGNQTPITSEQRSQFLAETVFRVTNEQGDEAVKEATRSVTGGRRRRNTRRRKNSSRRRTSRL